MIEHSSFQPSAEDYYNLAKDALAVKDNITAMARLNSAIKLDETDDRFALTLAKIYYILRSYNASNVIYGRLFAKNIEFDPMARIVENYLETGPKEYAKEFLTNSIVNHYKNKKFQQKSDYNDSPELQSVLFEVVKIFDGHSELNDKIADDVNGVKVINSEKLISGKYAVMAYRYFVDDDYDRAIEFGLMVKKICPQYVDMCALITNAAILQEDFELAKQKFYELMELNPQYADIFSLGCALAKSDVISAEELNKIEDKLFESYATKGDKHKIRECNVLLNKAMKYGRYEYAQRLAKYILDVRPGNADAIKATIITAHIFGDVDLRERYLKQYSIIYGVVDAIFPMVARYVFASDYSNDVAYFIFSGNIPPSYTFTCMSGFLEYTEEKLRLGMIAGQLDDLQTADLNVILHSQVEVISGFLSDKLPILYEISTAVIMKLVKNMMVEDNVPMSNKLLVISILLHLADAKGNLTISTTRGFVTIDLDKPKVMHCMEVERWRDIYINAVLHFVRICHSFDAYELAKTLQNMVNANYEDMQDDKYLALAAAWQCMILAYETPTEIFKYISLDIEFDKETLFRYVARYFGEDLLPKQIKDESEELF